MSSVWEWLLGASGWGVAGLLFYVYRRASGGWDEAVRAANASKTIAMAQAEANLAAFKALDAAAGKEITRLKDANAKLSQLIVEDQKLLETLSAHDPAILAPMAASVFAQLARVSAASRTAAPKDGVHGNLSGVPSPASDDPTRPIVNRIPLRAPPK